MYTRLRPLKTARSLALLWVLVTLFVGSAAHAQMSVDVANTLRGKPLGRGVAIFEDPTGSYDIDAISAPSFRARFVRNNTDTPNAGLSSSAYWIRLPTRNSSGKTRDWLLEVGYPHLDHVTLFIPKPGGGFHARATGDAYPFSQRDIAYRNFLFSLAEPPHSARELYLRVASTGPVNVPLAAWSLRTFIEESHLDWVVLCLFYGVVFIMAFYNAALYLMIRQHEFFYYAMFVAALGLMQLSLAGHTFQYLLPSHAWLANRSTPVSIALLVVTASAFAVTYVRFKLLAARLTKLLASVAGLLGVASFFLPYHLVIRGLIAVAVATCLLGFLQPLSGLNSGDRRSKLYLIGWGFFLAGAIANLLRFAGALPSNFITNWSMQIGAIVQIAFLSTALADSINVMRADLATLNDQLSDKVTDLEKALHRAEEATSRAEHATRAKDDFMATMSHEFRTPLNAIINIPQGLIADFPLGRYVVCSGCASTFELEPDEIISAEVACPDCAALGSLVERQAQRYVGNPEKTARYLSKIERSGRHLLQVVDGILDFSKLEAGRLRVERERAHLADLVQEAIEQLSDLAERSKVRLVSGTIAPEAYINVDPLRIRQVLINVIGNAIKFSDGKGTVTVDVCERHDCFRFSVRDEGIGIAKESLQTVFTSFEQVHKGNSRKYGGTGLGLSIARSLVRMHGGDMWVESTLGQGSTFFFSIPKRSSTAGFHMAALSPLESSPNPSTPPQEVAV